MSNSTTITVRSGCVVPSAKPRMKRIGFIFIVFTAGTLLGWTFMASDCAGDDSADSEDVFPRELVDFVPIENNPVFTSQEEGNWDAKIRERGWILREDDIYHMWYTGFTNGPCALGYATSPDGLSWTRHPENPLYADQWTEDMMVVHHQDTYYMFAEGLNDRAHLLSSTDGIQWKEHGKLDMRLANGEPLPDIAFGTPTAWFENGKWHLLYERNNDEAIWLATSKDLKVWTNVQDEPVMRPGPGAYDEQFVAVNQIIKQNGRYYIYYHGRGKSIGKWSTNVATSTDLIHWKKYANNPLLPAEENKSSGILVHDGQRYRLYTMHDQVHVHYPRQEDSLSHQLASGPHKILFESYVDDNWDLFIMDADGTGRRNLTDTRDVHEMYPQASPDGSKICFIEDSQNDGKTFRSVYWMNADGSGRTKVSEKARQPCWSPDGTKIAYVKQQYNRFSVDDHASRNLYIHDVKSGQSVEHPNKSIEHLYGLSWTGDGKWIVSTVHGGMGFSHAILAIEVDGPKVHNLQISGCRPCRSPDGSKITWVRDNHTICVGDIECSVSGGTVSNIQVVEHTEEAHVYHPDFSPDGKFITFSVGPGGRCLAQGPGTHTQVAEMVGVRAEWNLFVKRANGEGTAVQLTHDADLSNKESEWIRVQ